MSRFSHEMNTEAKVISDDKKKALLFAPTILAKKIMTFSVPMATVKLSTSRRMTKAIPAMTDANKITTSTTGQFYAMGNTNG